MPWLPGRWDQLAFGRWSCEVDLGNVSQGGYDFASLLCDFQKGYQFLLEERDNCGHQSVLQVVGV